MKIDLQIPVGSQGNWTIESFQVSKEQAALLSQNSSVVFLSGEYKRLQLNGEIIQTNLQDELRDYRQLFEYRKSYLIKGRALVLGLKLGIAVQYLIYNKNVSEIVIVEKDTDLISLCGSHYLQNDKVQIIHDNPKKYFDPNFDYVWCDVWMQQNANNYYEMKMLKSRWKTKPRMRIDCKGETTCQHLALQQKYNELSERGMNSKFF